MGTRRERQRGVGLVLGVVLALGTVTLGYAVATAMVASAEVRSAASAGQRLQASIAAEAGVERAISELKSRVELAPLDQPFHAVDALDGQEPFGLETFTHAGLPVAEALVRFDVIASAHLTRDVRITATGWAPSRSAYQDGRGRRVVIEAVERAALGQSAVFDYAYFIANWGWFYGSNITANGNVRASGQFDFGGYRAKVNAEPRFVRDVDGRLGPQIDSGGVYAGWGTVNTANVRGDISDPAYRHDDAGVVPMPNLSDLSLYETLAAERSGSITIDGAAIVSGVLGDDLTEPQNLYLEGTEEAPIVIDGPVVVRGHVIIKGVVSGIGTIYSGKNVYIADDLTYANPPSSPRPDGTDRATIQAWIDANRSADMLGLFARENISIGDPSNSVFRSAVSGWLNHSANESKEDLGLDLLPCTRKGRDGVLGTADDDVLEGDGSWTVECYTEQHAALGLLPEGREVGDPIAETGEDVDGDGVYDARISLADLDLSDADALDTSGAWAGNLPEGAAGFGDVCTIEIARIDGALYTNHALCARVNEPEGDITVNGAVVSRVESIVYSVPSGRSLVFNHDRRLLGGGDAFDFYLPRSVAPVERVSFLEQ